MTTKELSQSLKLHAITVCKNAAKGRIPAIPIGHVWRFHKDVIDEWIGIVQNEKVMEDLRGKPARRNLGRKNEGNEIQH